MSKILLIGYNPPQLEKNVKIEAAHYRTWQFLEPLLHDGHHVCLCTKTLSTNGTHPPDLPEAWSDKKIEYHTLPLGTSIGWIRQMQQIHDTFEPDCIVAVNFDCCLAATKLYTDKPIWMDIYGDYLTIIQVARYRVGSDRGIPTSIAFVKQVLQKGDSFSVCGTPQAHALVGELAMAGRLNSRTFGYEFSHVILPGSPQVTKPAEHCTQRTRLSKLGVPADSFVVLWCGGYNAWTDVETLFKGLEWAMSQNPRVHYVSVGANSYSAPDNVYDRLLNLVAQSSLKDRFHLLGWRPWAEVADYYRESDAGINIDALHYETIFGTRTRLVEMLGAGLPVITSLGSELSTLIGEYGAGLVFDSGDWQGMGQQILFLAEDEPLHNQMIQKAINYATDGLSFLNTTVPVRAWVKTPNWAPDNQPRSFSEKMQAIEYQARSTIRQLVWQVVGLDK